REALQRGYRLRPRFVGRPRRNCKRKDIAFLAMAWPKKALHPLKIPLTPFSQSRPLLESTKHQATSLKFLHLLCLEPSALIDREHLQFYGRPQQEQILYSAVASGAALLVASDGHFPVGSHRGAHRPAACVSLEDRRR